MRASRRLRPYNRKAWLTQQQVTLLEQRLAQTGLTASDVLREAVNAFIRGDFDPWQARADRLRGEVLDRVQAEWGEHFDPDDGLPFPLSDLEVRGVKAEPFRWTADPEATWTFDEARRWLTEVTPMKWSAHVLARAVRRVAVRYGVELEGDARRVQFRPGAESPILYRLYLIASEGPEAVSELVARDERDFLPDDEDDDETDEPDDEKAGDEDHTA